MYSQIKSLSMISIVLIFTAQHAVADNFSPEDMAFVFADSVAVTSDFGQMEVLSGQEMMETEGEFIPLLMLAYRIGKIGHSFYKMNRARTFLTYKSARNGFGSSVFGGATAMGNYMKPKAVKARARLRQQQRIREQQIRMQRQKARRAVDQRRARTNRLRNRGWR